MTMTSEEFVRRIQMMIYRSSIDGNISYLEDPPGRRPDPIVIKLSQWFKKLSSEDKEYLRAIIQMAVGDAVFGMLVILDGDRTIREAGEPLGKLELRYNVENQSILLNDPKGDPLHDIFRDLAPFP